MCDNKVCRCCQAAKPPTHHRRMHLVSMALSPRRAIVVSPIPIVPAYSGTQKYIYGQVCILRKLGYEVTLICYADDPVSLRSREKLGTDQLNILYTKREAPVEKSRYTAWALAAPLLSSTSINFIQELLDVKKPHVALFQFASFAYLTSLLRIGKNTKVLFRSHNCEYLQYLELAAASFSMKWNGRRATFGMQHQAELA